MDSFVLFVLDKFGELREFTVERYEYDGVGTIQFFHYAGGYTELVNEQGDTYTKANMDLIGVLHDIGGYWIGEVNDEKES